MLRFQPSNEIAKKQADLPAPPHAQCLTQRLPLPPPHLGRHQLLQPVTLGSARLICIDDAHSEARHRGAGWGVLRKPVEKQQPTHCLELEDLPSFPSRAESRQRLLPEADSQRRLVVAAAQLFPAQSSVVLLYRKQLQDTPRGPGLPPRGGGLPGASEPHSPLLPSQRCSLPGQPAKGLPPSPRLPLNCRRPPPAHAHAKAL